jgi:hypothetical protein
MWGLNYLPAARKKYRKRKHNPVEPASFVSRRVLKDSGEMFGEKETARWRCTVLTICLLAGVSLAGFTGQADCILKIKAAFQSPGTVQRILEEYSLEQKFDRVVDGIVPVRLHDGAMRSVGEISIILRSDHRIGFVEPDYRIECAGVPRDSLFYRQWALYNGRRERADIDIVDAWRVFTGSRRVIIGVIDTGIDYLHPDLAPNIWRNDGEIEGNGIDDDRNGYVDDYRGWNFVADTNDPMDRYAHGTQIAGIIGALVDNRIGIAGINHYVSLLACKGLSDYGTGFSSDLSAAVYYAVDNGAAVINASWGSFQYAQVTRDAIAYAERHNVLFVAAAGNKLTDTDQRPFYPASYSLSNIVSVAASDSNDLRSHFTNYGYTTVDLFAPGSEIISTTAGGGYLSNNGTSLSAPCVAGALGLMIGCSPDLYYHKYIEALLFSVDVKEAFRGKAVSGGRLNVAGCIRAILPNRNSPGYYGRGDIPGDVMRYLSAGEKR